MLKNLLLSLSLVLVLAAPAIAGDHGKKCDQPVDGCLAHMVTKLKASGFIGVELEEDKTSMRVTKVVAGSPAEAAGIREGDQLFAINGLRFSEENVEAISKVKVPGNEVTCTIKRNGVDHKLKMTLVPMPADLMAKYIGEHMLSHVEGADKPVTKK